eukprot:COSAG02_NODE_10605_length_1901_cov_25.574362_3_plen_100_part_01
MLARAGARRARAMLACISLPRPVACSIGMQGRGDTRRMHRASGCDNCSSAQDRLEHSNAITGNAILILPWPPQFAVTFALLIGNLARFWKSVTYNLNLTW